MAGLLEEAKGFLAEKLADIPKPEATVTDVDLKGVHLSNVDYNAKVSVNNPYSVSIPICEIDYVLKSSGRVIATGTVPDPGSLPGSVVTALDVPVKVPNSVLLSLLKDVCADWDIDYELNLAFIIDLPVVGNIKIPISSSGQIKLPTLSDLI